MTDGQQDREDRNQAHLGVSDLTRYCRVSAAMLAGQTLAT
jgi:hypothetical protein